MRRDKIPIVQSGGVELSLSVLRIGRGTPKTLLLTGIHGDERSGQLVVAELLRRLPRFRGTLSIVSSANPLAVLLRNRQDPLSGADLNRSFTGKNNGRPVLVLAEQLQTIAASHDTVIDLHAYTTSGLIQAGFGTSAGLPVVAALKPDVVRVEHSEKAWQLHGTISSALAEARTAYVLVELPHDQRITDRQITRVADGIRRHLIRAPRYARQRTPRIESIPFVRIKLVKAPLTGIFERDHDVRLGMQLRKGDKIGSMTDLSTGDSRVVRSTYAGLVCELDDKPRRAVVIGETLAGIGEPL